MHHLVVLSVLSVLSVLFVLIESAFSLTEFQTIPEIITSRGFGLETHSVKTEDGFLLGVHRIINPYIKERQKLKPIMYIHGMGVNAACFLVNGDGWLDKDGVYYEHSGNGAVISVNCDPEPNATNVQTHAFAMAACGYDVWLLNSRGTHYSKRHKYLTEDDNKFWHFSFQEIGWFDVPSTIDYILYKTKKSSLTLFSQSQGTSAVFVYLASKPDHGRDKVNLCISASPTAFFGGFIERQFGPVLPTVRDILKMINSFALNIYDGPVPVPTRLIVALASLGEIDITFINQIKTIFNFVFDSSKFNGVTTMSHWNMSRTSSYALSIENLSTYSMSHYIQLILTRKFIYHNRNERQNIKLYNQVEPPEIPLEKIANEKIILLKGDSDGTADQVDVDHLKQVLTVPVLEDVTIENFRHLDTVFGQRVGNEIITRMLRWLKDVNV